MSRSLTLVGVVVACLIAPGAASAQFDPDTDAWCRDATTVCWNDDAVWKPAGIRFIFEPQLGVLFQNGDNKFDNTNLQSLEKIGLATSLYGKQLGLQFLLIYPSTISFDEQSPLRVDGRLLDAEKARVDVEVGWTIGLTLLDGVLSVGYGQLEYDRRDFIDPATMPRSAFSDGFWYVNFQAIEAVKTAIKGS